MNIHVIVQRHEINKATRFDYASNVLINKTTMMSNHINVNAWCHCIKFTYCA